MAAPHEPEEVRQASVLIAIFSLIGLTICFVSAVFEKASVPIYLYAIFGGGVLGTDGVLKIIKAIFRVGGGNGTNN